MSAIRINSPITITSDISGIEISASNDDESILITKASGRTTKIKFDPGGIWVRRFSTDGTTLLDKHIYWGS